MSSPSSYLTRRSTRDLACRTAAADSHTLWTFRPEGQLQAWDLTTGRAVGPERQLVPPRHAVREPAFRADGGRVAVVLSAGAVRQFDSATGEPAGPAMPARPRTVQ